MPGPCSKSRVKGPDTGTKDKKARKRLQRRINGYAEPTDAMRIAGLWTHKPGSERK